MHRNFRNPNTPKLWNKRLFDENQMLLRSPIYINKIGKVFKYIKTRKGKFLDVGLGAGNLENLIINANLDIELFGIDISSKAVLNAKKQFGRNFFVADIFNLPFKKSFFDTAAILDVLEHIYKEEALAALNEINRVMKKGGHLVISVPLNENLKELDKRGENYNMHLREYTLKTISAELSSSGFKTLGYDFLYAFRNLYWLKSYIVKLVSPLRKPNLLIIYCKKK